MTGSGQAEFYIVIDHTTTLRQAVQWLGHLVAGPSPWMPGFNTRPVHVGFTVDKVATVFGQYSTLNCYHCSYIILANDITLN